MQFTANTQQKIPGFPQMEWYNLKPWLFVVFFSHPSGGKHRQPIASTKAIAR